MCAARDMQRLYAATCVCFPLRTFRGVVHRDIKPENILFSAQNTLKISDFGLAIDATRFRPVSRVGTPEFMAPEVAETGGAALASMRAPTGGSSLTPVPRLWRRGYSDRADIWSAGKLIVRNVLTF